MGEARYTMRIKFKDKKSLENALSDVVGYLCEQNACYHLWQHIRHDNKEPVMKRVEELRKFMDAMAGLKVKEDDVYLNAFAGCFLDTSFEFKFKILDKTIEISCIVWHFDDWTRHAIFFENLGGVKKVEWWSDEWLENK